MKLDLVTKIEPFVKESEEKLQKRNVTDAMVENYRPMLFVERYLEVPVYIGDANRLTIPSASTLRGIPCLDDY